MLYPTLGKLGPNYHNDARFRLQSFENVFSERDYKTLQDAFEEVPWKRKKEGFYEQYESFVLPSDKHALATLYHPSFFHSFKKRLESQMGVRFQNRIRLAAHKLMIADAIGMHNDYTLPELGHENFRFIFQFSNSEPVDGGELSFWSSKYTKEILQKFPYRRNFGVCFEITPYSFHSVESVKSQRHTLVMYLWEEGRIANSLGIEVH